MHKTYGKGGVLLALGDLSGLGGRLLLALGLTLELVGDGTLVLCVMYQCPAPCLEPIVEQHILGSLAL